MRVKTIPPWNEPATQTCLGPTEVHVWRARLDQPEAYRQDFARLLSKEEMERANRFLSPQDGYRFLVGRGLLRILLGQYLQVLPQELAFTYGPHGKPSILGKIEGRAIEFNLAHSEGYALYAVTLDRRVGIDIERIRPDRASDPIAGRFFSSAERAALRALEEAERQKAFYAYWTCKEAYTKATGQGLSCPLDSFTIDLKPGEPAALLHVHGDLSETGRWSFRRLGAFPGYADALVVEGQDWVLKCWEWKPETSP
ncbi:MAG TPA: 4'-phosphopantetheinyl transferase superfamily protein [Chthonomonadaceae bacterium]|nr:4'-phosphopantetheinyl transferase superfamily protein [Chthonomonadaceae bacterium]